MNQIASYQHIFTDEARERFGSAQQPTGQGLVALVRAGATVWNQWIADYPREEIVFSDIVFHTQDARGYKSGIATHTLNFHGFKFSENTHKVITFKQIHVYSQPRVYSKLEIIGLNTEHNARAFGNLWFENIVGVNVEIRRCNINGSVSIDQCKNTSFVIKDSIVHSLSIDDCELKDFFVKNVVFSFGGFHIQNTKLLRPFTKDGGIFEIKEVNLDRIECFRCDLGYWSLENKQVTEKIKNIKFDGCSFHNFYLNAPIEMVLEFASDTQSKKHRPCVFYGAPQLKIPDTRFHLEFDPSCVFPKATGSDANASAYRTIKQLYSNQDSRSQEFRFFCLEMNEERLQKSWWPDILKRLAFNLYWLCSDYGNSLLRPLLGLILVPALVAMVWAHHDQFTLSPSAFDWATTRDMFREMLKLLWPLDLNVDNYQNASKIVAKFIISLGWFLFALGLRNLLKLRA